MKVAIFIFLIITSILISCIKSTEPIIPSEWYLQRQQTDGIEYYSIVFVDENNGWIVGSSGTIKYSPNGGNTWQSQQSGVLSKLWDVHFIDNKQGWVCGDFNAILTTNDGGETWENISPYDLQDKIYLSILFVDKENGWTCNNNGEILRTLNGGISWDLKKRFAEGGGADLVVFDFETVYVFRRGKIFKTHDGGITWDSLTVSIPKNYSGNNIFFSDQDNGWITTRNGTGGMLINEYPVVITGDGGKTWFCSDYLDEMLLTCCYFVNNNLGWVAGVKKIYKTTDGGVSWTLNYESNNSNLSAKDMFFLNENSGWIINWSGEIYKYIALHD